MNRTALNVLLAFGLISLPLILGLIVVGVVVASNQSDESQATPTDTLFEVSNAAAILATVEAAPVRSAPQAAVSFDLGDPEVGMTLFQTFQIDAGFACSTCHWVDREDQLIGPGLLNIGARATARVEGVSAEDYIRSSIINPDVYIVEGFSDDLMPENWAEIYSEEEINHLIAYLFTLQ